MSQKNRLLSHQWKSHERAPKRTDVGGFGCNVLECDDVVFDASDWGSERIILDDVVVKNPAPRRRKTGVVLSKTGVLSIKKFAGYVVPSRRHEFISISKMQFDALVERLAILEAKVGVQPQSEQRQDSAISSDVLEKVQVMSEGLFGKSVKLTDSGLYEDGESQIVVRVALKSDSDPVATSRMVTEWHRRLCDIAPELPLGSIGIDLDFQ